MSTRPRRESFFAACPPGNEPYLLSEVRALKLSKPEGRPGGVHFEGTLGDAWRANLWLRTATRVLLTLSSFPAPDADALYAGVSGVDWSRFLTPDGTFVVDARTKRSALDHGLFVAQRVKDAVADAFRERHGRRPSVDRDDPGLRIRARIHRDRCTLLADTSGESLHKRGWRRRLGPAPLKETAAAALVMASGWDRRSPLLDPFCGSGTVLVEAALMAARHAPGLFRDHFAFERWPGHDASAYRAVVAEAREAATVPRKVILRGWDADRSAVERARENLTGAGISDRVTVEVAKVSELRPTKGWNAWVVTNPPYGERLGKLPALVPLYRRFGEILRERCRGFRVAVLCGNPALSRALGEAHAERAPMKNGPIDCEAVLFEVA